jgi:hypothetical protein
LDQVACLTSLRFAAVTRKHSCNSRKNLNESPGARGLGIDGLRLDPSVPLPDNQWLCVLLSIQHTLGRMVNYLPARMATFGQMITKWSSSMRKMAWLRSPADPVRDRRRISLALHSGYALRANAYRPNSRSISQPSRPAPASGRTEVRVGAGLPAALAGEGAFTGVLACEAACTRFEKKPPACTPGKLATGTP